MNSDHRIIIISAPSGAGKSTLTQHLLAHFPQLAFSVSATNRPPRGTEQEGQAYYFLTREEFAKRVAQGAFVEWEEVYPGTCYGTLKSELTRIWEMGRHIVFDVDVKGGVRLKEIFGARALSIFIQPPSIDVLQQRLEARSTDTPESIQKRLTKAQEEMGYAPYFDTMVINDDLDAAKRQIIKVVEALF